MAELGCGAIYEMARILDTFRRELPEPNLTYNVGVIGGGTPGRDRRRGADDHRRRQDQYRCRNRDRARRHPHPFGRAGGAGARPYAGDRRGAICRRPTRSSTSLPTAIRRWRRPRAIARCWHGSIWSIATSASRKCPNMTRPGAAPPIQASSPATPIPSPAWGPAEAAPMRRANGSILASLPRQAKRVAILLTPAQPGTT